MATLIAEALSRDQYKRLTKKDVIQIVVKAVREDLVSLSDREPKVREEIAKKLGHL